MMDRLFGMRSGPREALFQLFIRQPRFLKAAAIRTICMLGRKQVERLPTPSRLIFYVTNQCNAKCNHCFFSGHLNRDRGGGSLSLEEIERFAGSLKTRLRSLNLTGGEPVLRPDFADICRVFSERNRTEKITFPTNGLLPDRMASTVREVLEGTRLNVNAQVSLDGLRKTHDEMRGVKGAFDRALATVEALKSLTPHRNMNNLSVITTITRHNYREIEKLIDFVQSELGVFHKVLFARGSHSDVRDIDPGILSDFDPAEEEGCRPQIESLPWIFDLINRRLHDRDRSLISRRQQAVMGHALTVLLQRRKPLQCLAGRIDGVVHANGQVSMCEMTAPCASLREHDMNFFRLWHSEAAEGRRDQIRACYCTHPCNISTSMSYDSRTLLMLAERTPAPFLLERPPSKRRYPAR